MPFLNAEPCFGILSSYRLIWICGKFGGHKTALSMALAQEYLERGYRLVTNTKTVWADDINEVKLLEGGHLRAVVVLDEGGLYFKAGRQVEQIASYAAKMDCVYIIPSFWPPARAAQVLKIQPLFSLKSAGIPAIFYNWRVDIGGFHDKGWFVWWFPQEIYGVYSRQDPGAEPEDIISFLIERTNEYRKLYGRSTNGIQSLEEIKPEDIFSDSTAALSEAVDLWGSTLSTRKHRGR